MVEVLENPDAKSATNRPGLVVLIVVIGVVMAAVDTTIVVLALPSMERSLHIALSGIIWVIVGYLLVITVTATQVGRLGDMFGRVRMYEAGFLIFIVGSALCAVASNGATIIGFRVLQGLGGAFITANSGAVLADNFPPERRGRAYGFNAVGWNVGAILGILLGGVIITYVSWRWIFWINVPTGLAALGLAIPFLHDRGHRERQRIDWPGMITLGIGLFCILWAMVKLATVSFSGEVQAALAVGIAFIVVFAFIERFVDQPMVNLSMFRIPTMPSALLRVVLPGDRELCRALPGDHVPAGSPGPHPPARLAAARPRLPDRWRLRPLRRPALGPHRAGVAGHRRADGADRRPGHLRGRSACTRRTRWSWSPPS